MFTPKQNLVELDKVKLLQYFNSLFEQLAYRHSYYQVFDNFLDCNINSFCMNYNHDIMERIRKTYNQEERYIFGEMLSIWILYMDKHILNDDIFHDFYGNFYEANAMSKKHGFAQYFTPEPLCMLMASIVNVSNKKTVHEPACGSGRLNLAMHANNHKLFHHANDLDLTCAKMTTLNFLIHGVKGIVTCDDGLFPGTSFKGAFIINYTSAPFIEYVDNVDLAYKLLNIIRPKTNPNLTIATDEVKKNQIDISNLTGEITSLSELGKQLSLF